MCLFQNFSFAEKIRMCNIRARSGLVLWRNTKVLVFFKLSFDVRLIFSGLGNCYRILLELGPVSQDRAVLACALNNGSALPSFQAGEQIVSRIFYFFRRTSLYLLLLFRSTSNFGSFLVYWKVHILQQSFGNFHYFALLFNTSLSCHRIFEEKKTFL